MIRDLSLLDLKLRTVSQQCLTGKQSTGVLLKKYLWHVKDEEDKVWKLRAEGHLYELVEVCKIEGNWFIGNWRRVVLQLERWE